MVTTAMLPIALAGMIAAFLVYAKVLQTPAVVKKLPTKSTSVPWFSWRVSTNDFWFFVSFA